MAKPKYPQDEALKQAQLNAIRMLGLHKHNTPEERAKAMGFEPGWGHGSSHNAITEMRPSRTGAQGPGAYATQHLPETTMYAGGKEGATSYPLMVKRAQALDIGMGNPYEHFGVEDDQALKRALHDADKTGMVVKQPSTADWLKDLDVADYPERNHYVSMHPHTFRSRFAAFDPARAHEAGLNYAEGGDVNSNVEAMRRVLARAATSAGMKPTEVANKPLTDVNDFHRSLGDRVQEHMGHMNDMMNSTAFKYDVGHRVFTKGSAEKNMPPYKILSRAMVGNIPMRHPAEPGRLPKSMKDPNTGKTMRTPYEPGYKVRMEHPEGWSEFDIPESAIIGHLAAGGQPHFAKGGSEKEAALPLSLPRAPNMSTQEMQAHVDRMARQQTGEHVTRPGETTNLSGRSRREAERIKGVTYGLSPTGTVAPSSEYHGRVGDINVALPGDQTIADTMLEHINGTPINSQQEGGARYGAGKMHLPAGQRAFWASGEQPAQMFQNKVTELAKMTGEDPRIIAHHLAMGRIANNFAQHFADANLKSIEAHMVDPENMEKFNQVIRMGYEKQHPVSKKRMHISFPEFPGVENPDAAYMAMQKNPELRKWFNNRMKSSNLTKALGMPSGLDIEHAISEPALRNMEINLTGHSVGKMVPGASLRPGAQHGTYSHDILGEALGHAPELAPLDIQFPDASAYIRREYEPKDFTGTMQKVFPHQIVDPQHLDQMSKYYEMLRKTRGFADGGEVKHEANQDEMMAHVMLSKGKPALISLKSIGADEAPNMPIKEYVSPGGGKGLPVGGVDFQPENPGQQMMPGQPPGAPPPPPGAPPQGGPAPQGAPSPLSAPGPLAAAAQGPQSNILNMTRQGQAMQAMRATPPMPRMAMGGRISDIGMTERKL